jgi:hypothetical protein
MCTFPLSPTHCNRFCSYQEERGEWRFSGRWLLRNRGEFSCTHLNSLTKLELVRIGVVAIQFDLHFWVELHPCNSQFWRVGISIRLMKEFICARWRFAMWSFCTFLLQLRVSTWQGSHTTLATPRWTCCNSSAMLLLMLVTLNLKSSLSSVLTSLYFMFFSVLVNYMTGTRTA